MRRKIARTDCRGFFTSILQLYSWLASLPCSSRRSASQIIPPSTIDKQTGIGVGNSSASPTNALLLSVLQDSMGRLATILFASRLGSSLEPECKMYRLMADIFNDAAMILDCASPWLPSGPWRVICLGGSSVLRSLCGVAAGSAKASLSAHFAVCGNLGELNAVCYLRSIFIENMKRLMLVGHHRKTRLKKQ